MIEFDIIKGMATTYEYWFCLFCCPSKAGCDMVPFFFFFSLAFQSCYCCFFLSVCCVYIWFLFVCYRTEEWALIWTYRKPGPKAWPEREPWWPSSTTDWKRIIQTSAGIMYECEQKIFFFFPLAFWMLKAQKKKKNSYSLLVDLALFTGSSSQLWRQ